MLLISWGLAGGGAQLDEKPVVRLSAAEYASGRSGDKAFPVANVIRQRKPANTGNRALSPLPPTLPLLPAFLALLRFFLPPFLPSPPSLSLPLLVLSRGQVSQCEEVRDRVLVKHRPGSGSQPCHLLAL